MPETKDLWYVRFPDGRVRGGTIAVIRQQLASGRLPAGTRVRRSGDADWAPIDRVAEFAEPNGASGNGNGAAPAATIASRLDPGQMHLPGVRPMLEELLGALDSTFVSRKLKVAAFAGLLLGAVFALTTLPLFGFSLSPPGLGWLLPFAAVVVWSWLVVVLSKMTFAELSRLRPATWSDGMEGSFRATVHLSFAHGIMILLLGAVVFGLRFLPVWLPTLGDEDTAKYFTVGGQAANVAGVVLELLVWPIFVLLLPLGAMLVVEQASFAQALGKWLSLVWRKGWRILMAELLALGIGLLLSAPLAFLGALVASRFGEGDLVGAIVRCLLFGLLSSLLLAYLVVANVYLYLSESSR